MKNPIVIARELATEVVEDFGANMTAVAVAQLILGNILDRMSPEDAAAALDHAIGGLEYAKQAVSTKH